MSSQSFFVPCKPVSWNKIASAHWRTYKRLKDETARATYYAVKESKIKPFAGPVDLTVTAYWKTKRIHDVDNICIKSALDILVKTKILQGDDMRYVSSVTLKGKNGCKEEGLFIQISSLD